MSGFADLIGRLLGRASKLPIDEVAAVVQRAIAAARGNRARYRELMLQAVRAGDLDPPFDAWKAANDRAQRYVEEG